jgi:hypothetical protein
MQIPNHNNSLPHRPSAVGTLGDARITMPFLIVEARS